MNSRYLLTGILILVVGYGFFKATPLLRGPRIDLSELTTDQNGLTTISGKAIHTENMTFDGGALLIDAEGHFQEKLTLPKGGAILSLTATDRFGRSQTLERAVITP